MIRLFVLFLMLSSWQVFSEPVVIEGKAPIGKSAGVAKRQALQDAERNAVNQAGGQIQSESLRIPGGVKTTTQVDAPSRWNESEILNVQQTQGEYKVQAKVNVNKEACNAQTVGYRKKIALTAFPVLHAEHVTDVGDVPSGYATELYKVLFDTDRFLLKNAARNSIYDRADLAPALNAQNDNNRLITLADNLDVQFIIGGVILDMGYNTPPDRIFWTAVNEVFSIPPLNRRLRVELYVYDGLTGAMIERASFSDSVSGRIYFENGTHFNSEEFLSSTFGELINKSIHVLADDVVKKLSCFPLMERILRVEGNQIYFNAGAMSNIHVGDTLMVYHQSDNPIPGVYFNNSLRGFTETANAVMTVTQVQPQFSIGVLDAPVQSIGPMDIIRSW